MYGRRLGLPVVFLDTFKGFLPAFIGVLLVSHLCGIVAGAAAMLGHGRPLFLRFAKGGKMVATCGGVFFGVAFWVALTAGGVWLLVFLATRYASVASILAAISLPIIAAIYGYPTSVIVFGVLAAAVVVFLHRANVRRLRAGTENRFQLRRAARA
jgi:glycerol-3-phosphate acyltransferase PlsY